MHRKRFDHPKKCWSANKTRNELIKLDIIWIDQKRQSNINDRHHYLFFGQFYTGVSYSRPIITACAQPNDQRLFQAIEIASPFTLWIIRKENKQYNKIGQGQGIEMRTRISFNVEIWYGRIVGVFDKFL